MVHKLLLATLAFAAVHRSSSVVTTNDAQLRGDSRKLTSYACATLPTEKVFEISARHSGKTIHVEHGSTQAGAYLVQKTSDPGKADNFVFQYAGNSRYHVVNEASSLAWWVLNNSHDQKAPIAQNHIDGGSPTKDNWCFVDAGDGYYYVFNEGTGLSIDLGLGSKDDGAQLFQANFNGNACQQFKLTEVQVQPVCQAEHGGCGGGEVCCAGLDCHWAEGGHRLCLSEKPTICAYENDGCGGGETCCGTGTTCQWAAGGHRLCLPECQAEYGGCGSGESCCSGLSCQWAPGGHRRCLVACREEHQTCSSDYDCCFGTTCEHSVCQKAYSGQPCHDPVVGDLAHNECRYGTLSDGQCVLQCCTDGRVITNYSPLALDTDGSGLVERVHAMHLQFDIDGNGDLEDLYQWFAPTEGILINADAITNENNDKNGLVLTGKHLFGDEGGKYKNGFDKLSKLDVDGDGFVSGDEMSGLMLWFDTNVNAFLDDGELKDVSEFNIASLSLYEEKMVGHATLEDGRQMRMEDLWFEGQEVVSSA